MDIDNVDVVDVVNDVGDSKTRVPKIIRDLIDQPFVANLSFSSTVVGSSAAEEKNTMVG